MLVFQIIRAPNAGHSLRDVLEPVAKLPHLLEVGTHAVVMNCDLEVFRYFKADIDFAGL